MSLWYGTFSLSYELFYVQTNKNIKHSSLILTKRLDDTITGSALVSQEMDAKQNTSNKMSRQITFHMSSCK